MHPGSEHTLVSLFLRRVSEHGRQPAIWFRRDAQPLVHTWSELADDVRRMAAALVTLGLEPGDRLGQISENRYEWIVTDLACYLAQAVHVPMHSSLAAGQIAWQLRDCGAKIAVLSGDEQAAMLDQSADQLAGDLKILSHDPCRPIGGREVLQMQTIVAAAEQGGRLERAAEKSLTPGSLATILYTSGTTGEPKGVMLSHGNLASNAIATLEAFELRSDDARVCWLPLSHVFARTCDLYTWLAQGGFLGLAKSRDTVLADCQQLGPRTINGVPYFYEKICRFLEDRAGLGESVDLKALLGGKIEVCVSGGAALPDHIAEYFRDRGVPLVQGYGLSETSPVITLGTRDRHRTGTVGQAIPGVEVRIAADGEILTRGPHVMLGYWNNARATADAIRDGWFHTGDVGAMEGGYLRITGRKKELLVTAGGKNVAPAYLEALLCADPLVAQAIVVGDGRNYLTALIVPDGEQLRAEIERRRIGVSSAAEALVHPEVRALYAERVEERLRGVSHCEQVRKFTLLSRGFSPESGELTPTLKVRRSAVVANFKDEIGAMYSD